MLGFSHNMFQSNIMELYHSMLHQMIPIYKLYVDDVSIIHNYNISQNKEEININLNMLIYN